MRSILSPAAIAAGLLVASASPAAYTLSNDPYGSAGVVSGDRFGAISYIQPVGQSFTAVGSTISSFGFQFEAVNTQYANDPITWTLRQGEGLAGAVIASTQFTIPGNTSATTPTWFDFATGNVAVTAGQLYTAVLTTTASLRNGIIFGPDFNIYTGVPLSGDEYAGGKLIGTVDPDAAGYCNRTGGCDLSFRINALAAPAAVPEPASWAMMVGGFGLLGTALRRRRTAAFAR